MRLSQRWMVAVVGGCAAVLTACGSSGGGLTTGSTPGGTGGITSAGSSGGGSSASTASGTSTGGGSGTTGGGRASGQLCPQLRAAEAAAGAGTPTGSGSNPADQKAQIEKAITVYKAIGDGAPPNVQKASSDMVDVLTTLEGVYADPTHPDVTKLAQLSPRLTSDTQVISAYVAANCH